MEAGVKTSPNVGRNLQIFIANEIGRTPVDFDETKKALNHLEEKGLSFKHKENHPLAIQNLFEINPWLFIGLEAEMCSTAIKAIGIYVLTKDNEGRADEFKTRVKITTPPLKIGETLRNGLTNYFFRPTCNITDVNVAKGLAEHYIKLYGKFKELFPYFERGCKEGKCESYKDGICTTHDKYYSDMKKILKDTFLTKPYSENNLVGLNLLF